MGWIQKSWWSLKGGSFSGTQEPLEVHQVLFFFQTKMLLWSDKSDKLQKVFALNWKCRHVSIPFEGSNWLLMKLEPVNTRVTEHLMMVYLTILIWLLSSGWWWLFDVPNMKSYMWMGKWCSVGSSSHTSNLDNGLTVYVAALMLSFTLVIIVSSCVCLLRSYSLLASSD